ncbi:hypothetical protein EDI_149080 [Entamoeba dispar SAW760]|uniref:Uncharacterized protein n=1 Tax=Entamoeba dispar (strain ATCC PRA-260 / SAW760) TaxID=370354 RepID=B0EDT9_ENTDS|nr:uncharacterized protein EDI_149080 [Entamoeba dispar SAW760]EDR27300.1 hypothetical protein EDI_149080 [Entamoeba dispar SAW760]|eukprot:EDR27300.1 hypothetical protein EDI_149080 [Entamoeba dispar SAW760]
MSFPSVTMNSNFKSDNTETSTQPQPKIPIKNERSVGTIPQWNEEENQLLDQQMKTTNFLENTDMLYKLQSLFPNKSSQQILNRIKWVAGGKKQNWEEFCVQCSYQPFTISTYQKYTEHREQIPKINPQIQTIHSIRPLQSQIKQEGKTTLPQQIQNTIPIIQQTPTHPLPSSNQVIQQQIQIKSINTSNQLQRSNQIGQVTPGNQPIMQEIGNQIQTFIQTKQQTQPIHYQQYSQINSINNTLSQQQQTQLNIPITIPLQQQILEDKLENKKKPKISKLEKDDKTKKQSSRKRKTKEIEKNIQQPLINSNEIEEQIKELIENNEQVLASIEISLQTQELLSLDRQWIITFGSNIKNLLSMTDTLAKPARLPFLSLALNLPPELADIQQFPTYPGINQIPQQQTNIRYQPQY